MSDFNTERSESPQVASTPEASQSGGQTVETPDTFVADTVSDIASSLFGKKETPAEASVSSGAGEVTSDEPVSPTEEEAPAPAPTKPLPKSWRKEMDAHWATLPPEVQDYVHEREAQVLRGISEYKAGHENWSRAVEQYTPYIQQSGANPGALVSNLLGAHFTLLFGEPAQKQDLITRIAQTYGLSVGPTPEGQPQTAVDPRVDYLQRELMSLQGTLKSQKEAEVLTQVNAFFANTEKYPHAEAVSDNMYSLISSGVAKSLEHAYELAVWQNPAVRELLVQERLKSVQPPATNKTQEEALRRMNGAMSTGNKPTPPKRKMTMDETIAATAQAAYNRS